MLHVLLIVLALLLSKLSQLTDVLILLIELAMRAYNCVLNLYREIGLLISRKRWVRVSNLLHELHKLGAEVVASFLGHLSWEMVNRVEKN